MACEQMDGKDEVSDVSEEEVIECFRTVLFTGQEKEPKLPPMVLPALLKLLNMANMNPVKVTFHLQEHSELMNESYKVCEVLDAICEKSMKAKDDVRAVKSHYFASIIRKAKDYPSLEAWNKWLVKGRDLDGHPENQDKLIRQTLKDFPNVESQLLQNMDKRLSNTKLGDSPTSLDILNQAVNGQKFGFDAEQECSSCGETNAKTCAKCKMAFYCNATCQKLHWSTHKKFCSKLAAKRREDDKKKMKDEKKQENKKSSQNGSSQKNEEPNENKDNMDVAEGGETGLDLALSGVNLPDIEALLENEEIAKAYRNPKLRKALEEISQDPRNIEKYKDDEDLINMVQTVPDIVLKLTSQIEGKEAEAKPAVHDSGCNSLEKKSSC